MPLLDAPSVAEIVWVPAVAAGTVKVVLLVKVPFVSVLTDAGLVGRAAVSNLKPETVELPVKPAPCMVIVAPGLAGVPAAAPLGVSVSPGITL